MKPKLNTDLNYEAQKFCTRKSLGQNFLVDKLAIDKIIQSFNLDDYDAIVEIGCGAGFLTRYLANSQISTIALDIDKRCVDYVNNLKLINTNAFEINALDFDFNKLPHSKIIVLGNIPYQITTPLLTHLFGEIGCKSPFYHRIKAVVLTIQYEVAVRLMAKPGDSDYSSLTILTNYFFDIEFIQKIRAQSFHPVPKIDSATIKLIPKTDLPEIESAELLKKIIYEAFRNRRKMLKNTISRMFGIKDIDTIFEQLNFDLLCRPQDLSLDEYLKLTQTIKNIKLI